MTGEPPIRRTPGPLNGMPRWFWAAFTIIHFWYLTIPATIALALVGWIGADWLQGFRWIVFGAATLLALPLSLGGTLTILGAIHAARKLAARQRLLDRDETVAGLPLPIGTKIQFRDEAHTGIESIDLPRPTKVRGALVAGRLKWNDIQKIWSGMLAEDQDLGGLPCRGPDAIEFDHHAIEFDDQGIVQRCQLASAHELLGFTLPRGTTVYRGDNSKPWRFRLPPNAGVAILALATSAPPGVTLSVANDGRLVDVGSGHGQTIVVRDVPLASNLYVDVDGYPFAASLYVRGDHVVGALKEPFMVAGEMQPAGTGVRIDLTSGDVSLAGKTWWQAND
jgi:hypothetical protein